MEKLHHPVIVFGKTVAQEKLSEIAQNCRKYLPITEVQGYGISMLNNLAAVDFPRCDWCIHWLGGSCDIFEDEIKH